MQLRQYQREAVDAVTAYWAAGGGNPLVDLATGTGKSVVIATLARELVEAYPDLRVLLLVHVKELVEQDARALTRAWPGAPVGINAAGLGRRDQRQQLLCASIQSVQRLDAHALGPRDLVLIDEAHLVPATSKGMYRKLIDRLRRARADMRVAGFTATAYRLDSGRLDEGDDPLFDDVVYSYGIAEGVRDGHLARLVSRRGAAEVDVSGVQRRGGEFVAGSLEAAADRADLVAAAADDMVARGADRRSWIAFCAGVAHAHHVRDALRARGVGAEVITGETPHGERDRLVRDFREGRLRCLTNANVLTTGFDAPGVDLVAMLRPTLSTGLYVQCLGRGTRLAPGKADCLVLDFAGNVRRHGPVDRVEVRAKGAGKAGARDAVTPSTVRAKECPACLDLVPVQAAACPCCGHEWPREAVKHAARAEDVAVLSEGDAESFDARHPVPRPAPREVDWRPVSAVTTRRHDKAGGKPSLRVDYRCGYATFTEWVTLEHDGVGPRGRARAWWSAMTGGSVPMAPATVDEALKRAAELDAVTAVAVVPDGAYTRVARRRVERRNGRVVEVDNLFRVNDAAPDAAPAPLLQRMFEGVAA